MGRCRSEESILATHIKQQVPRILIPDIVLVSAFCVCMISIFI